MGIQGTQGPMGIQGTQGPMGYPGPFNGAINFNTTTINTTTSPQLTFPSNFPITGGTSTAALTNNQSGIGLYWNETLGEGETNIICYGQGSAGGLSIWGGPSFSGNQSPTNYTPANTTPVKQIADLWTDQIKFYQDVSFNENVELSPYSQLTFNNNGISNASIVIPSFTGGATSQSLPTTQSLVFSASTSNNLQLYYDGSNPVNTSWGFQVPNTSNTSDPSNGGEPSNFVLNFPGKTITLTASTIDLTASTIDLTVTSGINMSSINISNNSIISFPSSMPSAATSTPGSPTGLGIGYNLTTGYEVDLICYGGNIGSGTLNIYGAGCDGGLSYLTIGRTTPSLPYVTTTGIINAGLFESGSLSLTSTSQSSPTLYNLSSGCGTFYNTSGIPYFAYNPPGSTNPPTQYQLATLSGGTEPFYPQIINGYNKFENALYINGFPIQGLSSFPLTSLPPNTNPGDPNGSLATGFALGWNLTGSENNPPTNGGGETDFFSYGQGGLGGFDFYATNYGNSPIAIAQLRADYINFNNSVTCTSSISASTFSTTSDYRIKENVTELNETYSVDNLRPVEYENKITNKQSLGFIAHEVQEQYPFLVTGEKDGKDNQSINYQEIIPILVKEIQDLKKRVTLLEN